MPPNLLTAINSIPPWAYIVAGVALLWAIITRIAKGG